MMNAMMKQKFLNQYQQTSVETNLENASPHKLVTMLYDGVVGNLAAAKGAIQRKSFEQKAEKINKAILIIGSLRANLDLENGGAAADNYQALYSYMNQTLLTASLKNNEELLDEVIQLTKELKDTWLMMPDNFKNASKEQIEMLKA